MGLEIVTTSSGIHSFKYTTEKPASTVPASTLKSSSNSSENTTSSVNVVGSGDAIPSKVVDVERKNLGTLLDIRV